MHAIAFACICWNILVLWIGYCWGARATRSEMDFQRRVQEARDNRKVPFPR